MLVQTESEAILSLEGAARFLQLHARDSDLEMSGVVRGFEELAQIADAILILAGGIMSCVESESVTSVLPQLQSLGAAAQSFIAGRLQSTAGILETVRAEARLLGRFAELTRGQRSIARETQMLSVLTNIEVARLGETGAGFKYLARELDDFSRSVAKGTRELAGHAEERRLAIEETRRMLSTELPATRQELVRIEAGLGGALEEVTACMGRLARMPARFRVCVEEIAGQITGVVTAIQAHDITRQQVEHVHEAVEEISAAMRKMEDGETGAEHDAPQLAAGLRIQSYQLQSIRQTVNGWVTQIGDCVESILNVSSSDLVLIGPMVLEQERQLSLQLARIEELEQACQRDNAEVERTLAGLASLMQLVGEHLKRSKVIRDRLRLLTFNSIIEASRLGSQADGILEISQSIKRVSEAWSGLTAQSAQAMEEILALVERAKQGTSAFSRESNALLRQAQTEMRMSLEGLRAAAASVAGQADEIDAATVKLQGQIGTVRTSMRRIDTCFGLIGQALDGVEAASGQFEVEFSPSGERCDSTQMEERFGATYTTELERMVLRAALAGDPLPTAQQSLAGNDVELF